MASGFSISFHGEQLKWHYIVRKLAKIIKENDWSQNFAQAIHDAKKANIPDLDPINSLEDYLNDINNFLFWKPIENKTGNLVYNKLCAFYWILEQPSLALLQSQILPKEASKPLTILSEWIIDYANAIGTFHDSEKSIDAATIETFYNSPPYHMDDYVRPLGDWKTFNEFFARHVKKGKRDPDEPTNPEVIVSPADSVFDGDWDVDDENNLFFVKGIPWNIELLLDGSKWAKSFKGGTFMHAFLGPADYHRQHAPIMGTILEAKIISGAAYLEVVPVTNPTEPSRNKFAMRRLLAEGKTDANIIQRQYLGIHHPVESEPVNGLDAPDNPGYQFLQARGCIVIDSPVGLVAVLPIGMAQVSSVKLSVKEGDKVKKGQEISYFQFGGSDIILVFEKGSGVKWTAELKKHYNTGKKIGTAKVPKLH
jgi:phosphatidylserine decarboxylase